MAQAQNLLTLAQNVATIQNGHRLIDMAELADASGHRDEAIQLVEDAYLLFDLYAMAHQMAQGGSDLGGSS